MHTSVEGNRLPIEIVTKGIIVQTPVSIVIVNWKSRAYLIDLIDSLQEQEYRPLDVVVVNNSSEDELAFGKYSQHDFSVRVLEPNTNLGFAGGTNLGIRASTAPLIMLLNPDTLVPPGALARLVERLESDPRYDVALPKIMLGKETDVFDRVWDGYSRWGQALTIGYRERDEGQYDLREEGFGARGAACLFRRSFFQDVGFFDEDLFAFYEDVDLSLRGQIQGKRFAFVSGSSIIHFGNASTGSLHNPTIDRLTARNKILVFMKDMPGFLLCWHLWRLPVLMVAGFIQHAFIVHDGRAYCGGILDAIRGLPRIWRKRREVQKKRTVSIRKFNSCLKQCEKDHTRSLKTQRMQQGSKKPWFLFLHK